MIPESFVEQWREHAPWQSLAMVEQDLIISRALIELYSHVEIQKSLVFRGGTALYQRRKGRDLFDLWLVLKNKLINPQQTVEIFSLYANYNNEPITRAMFEKNIFEKEQHPDFAKDMTLLLSPTLAWSSEEAFHLVKNKLLTCLYGEAWKKNASIIV